ncbi:hypothetical protein M877_14455 [Streptomyces niveus NCIMB 11891]|nr:hypothetical protein M877_14455 [Streptomyces niveus NCIMB 11891]
MPARVARQSGGGSLLHSDHGCLQQLYLRTDVAVIPWPEARRTSRT